MLKKFICAAVAATSILTGYLSGEQTLSILKPDAIANKHIGEILTLFETNGLQIAALKMIKLTPEKAGDFYAEHKGRPYYNDLVTFMSSGPVVVAVLKGDNAVQKYRDLMGSTDPKKAPAGTIRALFSESIGKNTVHGSDSVESAKREIPFFFKAEEIVQ